MKRKNIVVIDSYNSGVDAILEEHFSKQKQSDNKFDFFLTGVVLAIVGALLCW